MPLADEKPINEGSPVLLGKMANSPMNAAQKASGLVGLRIAQSALIEVLTSSGRADQRPQAVTDAVHAAIELLENAKHAFEQTKVE